MITRLGRQSEVGFDTNTVIDSRTALAMRKEGWTFAVRYLPRITQAAHDLTRHEVDELLWAGLSVMPVQHVQSANSWEPTVEKGNTYGITAVRSAIACGFRPGCTVWLDLEGVAVGTPHQQVIDYCREWYTHVKAAGFEPGVYVGWHCGLNASELYYKLPFTRYWSAYNLNTNERPAVRGVCMKQWAANTTHGVALDGNTISRDALGGFPTLLAPDAT